MRKYDDASSHQFRRRGASKVFKQFGPIARAIAFGMAGAILLVLATETFWMFHRNGFCSLADQNGAVCLREWLASLSGWAAAIAAVVAIGPLIYQLREQRRQTRFLIGDAEPTVDVERKAPLSIRVRIVNWNRRSLIVHPGRYSVGGKALSIQSIRRENENQRSTDTGHFNFTILGWEDRAARPSFSELMIELETPSFHWDLNASAIVQIEGKLVGEGGGLFFKEINIASWGDGNSDN